MDGTELILTGRVSPPATLEHLTATLFHKPATEWDPEGIDGLSEEKKKQIAKDFESILINRLLDEMKSTIGDWGFEKDGASEQVHGIFWLYLARDIANSGGFGMWKDIYRSMTEATDANKTIESL